MMMPTVRNSAAPVPHQHIIVRKPGSAQPYTFIPSLWFTHAYDRIVYTAITRSKENIFIINANVRYWEFGEGIPDEWR